MIACEAVIELKENTASRAQPGFDSQKRTPLNYIRQKSRAFGRLDEKIHAKQRDLGRFLLVLVFVRDATKAQSN
jgi:hypothetical protein